MRYKTKASDKVANIYLEDVVNIKVILDSEQETSRMMLSITNNIYKFEDANFFVFILY